MDVHLPSPEEGYYFDKAKKKNAKTRWRVLLFFVILAIIILGLILNGFSFDFSDKLSEPKIEEKVDSRYGTFDF